MVKPVLSALNLASESLTIGSDFNGDAETASTDSTPLISQRVNVHRVAEEQATASTHAASGLGDLFEISNWLDENNSRKVKGPERYTHTYQTLDNVLISNEFQALATAVADVYKSTKQNPKSGVLLYDCHQEVALRRALKTALNDFTNYGKRGPGDKAAQEVGIIKNKLVEQVIHIITGRNPTEADLQTRTIALTKQDLHQILFGIKDAVDQDSAPLFNLAFALSKPSDERKNDKKDRTTANLDDPHQARIANIAAFKTSSGVVVQAVHQREKNISVFRDIDNKVFETENGIAKRTSSLLKALDNYYQDCKRRSDAGEVVATEVLSDLKKLLDKSWNPVFGGIGRFSISDSAARESFAADYWKSYKTTNDFAYNSTANLAFQRSIESYKNNIDAYSQQVSEDALLGDLRAVQLHSLVGQLLNDILLKPEYASGTVSNELKVFENCLKNENIFSADVNAISEIQLRMRASPLLMEFNLSVATDAIAKKVIECLDITDQSKKAASTQILSEALMRSDKTLLDPVAGFRGRFKGITAGEVHDISGRSETNNFLLNLPDEALDEGALKEVRKLLKGDDDRIALDGFVQEATKRDGYYHGYARPVTAVREQTLPEHIRALVNAHEDCNNSSDTGQKQALEISARLARQHSALLDDASLLRQEIKQTRDEARPILTRYGRTLNEQELIEAMLPSFADSVAESLFSANLDDPALVALQKKYDVLLEQHHEIIEKTNLTLELQQKFILAAAPVNSINTIVAQTKEVLNNPELKKFVNLEFKLSDTSKGESLKQLETDSQKASDLKSRLESLNLKDLLVTDLQGKVHTLGLLVNQESVSGLIHRVNQRTLCGISGTTTDLMLALTAEYGQSAVNELLKSIWNFSDPNLSSIHVMSDASKQMLTSVSLFMQRGNYHTPAEVAGGLLVAAGAILDMPEAKSAPDIMARYNCLMVKMEADPAGLFIQDVGQQAHFRSNLSTTVEGLFPPLTPSLPAPSLAPEAPKSPAVVPAPEAMPAVIAPPETPKSHAVVPAPLAMPAAIAPPEAPKSPVGVPAPEAMPAVIAPPETPKSPAVVPAPLAMPAAIAPPEALKSPANIPAPERTAAISAFEEPEIAAASETLVASGGLAVEDLDQSTAVQLQTKAERSLAEFAEILQIPQALDYDDAYRKAEETEQANALDPLQSYEASRQQLEIDKESLKTVNKTLSDLITATTTNSLSVSGVAKFQINELTGHIEYPELGAVSEAINTLGAGFSLVGSALTLAHNVQRNRVLLAQIANIRQNLAQIKPILDAHSELHKILEQRHNDLEAATNQKRIDATAVDLLQARINELSQLKPTDEATDRQRQDELATVTTELAATQNRLQVNAMTIKLLEGQIGALNRTMPRLTEFVAQNKTQYALNADKLSALEHKVRLANTSSVLAGFSIVKAPTAVIKDALLFSGSASASTVGKSIGVAFLPLSMAKTIFSSVKLTIAAHEATKIGWKRNRLKDVQSQLRQSANSQNNGQNPQSLGVDGTKKPVNAAFDRLLTASLESLQTEKKQKRLDGLADGLDVLGGLTSVATGALAAAGLALSSSGVLAPIGLAVTAAGALLGISGALCVLGAAYWRNRNAKKNKNQLHDAQIGLANLRNGISLDGVAKKNPLIKNMVKIEAKRLRREQTAQFAPISKEERENRITQAVMERCAQFIENKHHNYNATLTCNALNAELGDMASKLKAIAGELDGLASASDVEPSNEILRSLTLEERALLRKLVNDRPISLVGAIPAPDHQNPSAQSQYFDLVKKVISLGEGDTTSFDAQYPVAASLSVLGMDTGFLSRDQEYGAQGIASIYYSGSRKAAADTLLVMLGVAPIPVAEATAETYFKTLTGFAAASSSSGLASAPHESAAAAVLQILRKHRDLGESIMVKADEATGTTSAIDAFSKVAPVGEMVTRPHVKQAIDQLTAFAAPRVSADSTRPPAPTTLLENLVGKVDKGNSYIELSREDVDFRENFRSRRRGNKTGSQFVNGLEKKFKSYGDQKFTGPLFVGIRRKTDKRDRYQFHLSVEPNATCKINDGDTCKPDFLICNRASIASRAEYVTYDRVGSQWFLSTANQRIEITLDPEIIRQKISSLTTSVAEKMLYIQVQKDISDNCELIGFEVAPARPETSIAATPVHQTAPFNLAPLQPAT